MRILMPFFALAVLVLGAACAAPEAEGREPEDAAKIEGAAPKDETVKDEPAKTDETPKEGETGKVEEPKKDETTGKTPLTAPPAAGSAPADPGHAGE